MYQKGYHKIQHPTLKTLFLTSLLKSSLITQVKVARLMGNGVREIWTITHRELIQVRAGDSVLGSRELAGLCGSRAGLKSPERTLSIEGTTKMSPQH